MFVYLDESGDTGWKFARGSSRYFVVTLLLVETPEPFYRVLDQLRQALRFSSGEEFKFSKSSVAVREQFLRTIDPLAFQVRALIVDKQALTQAVLQNDEPFYSYLVQLALNHELISGATLILDESFRGRRPQEGLQTYLRRTLNTQVGSPKLTRIVYRRSHTDVLLQVSDMVCGAIYAAYARENPRYRAIIRQHIYEERALLQSEHSTAP